MIYRENIVDKKITDLVRKYLNEGFKKEVTLVKKTNGAKRQLINGFYINKNGKFLNLYYKSSNEHTSLAYGVKRLICI